MLDFGLLLILPPAMHAGPFTITGPDAFGYSGVEIGYAPRNISSRGTALTDDSVSSAVSIGFSFSFSFYGNAYDYVYVSSNGFIMFGNNTGSGCCEGPVLPSTSTPNNLVAGWWADLNPSAGGTIRYLTQGSAGSQEFIVGFYDVPHYPSGNPVSMEMILHQGSNNIELQYISAPTDGGTHSIGIENSNGTIGLLAYRGTADGFASQGYLFSLDGGAGGEIPEPATMSMLGLGLLAIGLLARRRK